MYAGIEMLLLIIVISFFSIDISYFLIFYYLCVKEISSLGFVTYAVKNNSDKYALTKCLDSLFPAYKNNERYKVDVFIRTYNNFEKGYVN